jgi:hypothetical protein
MDEADVTTSDIADTGASGSDRDRRRAMFDERVESHDRQHPGYKNHWRELEAILRPIGGWAIVARPDPDPLVGDYLRAGRTFASDGVRIVSGLQRECHRNCANLWRTGDAIAIGTGYALSVDGLWREHSWAWDHDGSIIETTDEREYYFGLQMEGEYARWFADWVDPECGTH